MSEDPAEAERASDRSTSRDWVPIGRDELPPVDVEVPADGVKVGGAGSFFPWTEPEPEPEPEPALFPWVAVVWIALAGMAVMAVWAVIWGR